MQPLPFREHHLSGSCSSTLRLERRRKTLSKKIKTLTAEKPHKNQTFQKS